MEDQMDALAPATQDPASAPAPVQSANMDPSAPATEDAAFAPGQNADVNTFSLPTADPLVDPAAAVAAAAAATRMRGPPPVYSEPSYSAPASATVVAASATSARRASTDVLGDLAPTGAERVPAAASATATGPGTLRPIVVQAGSLMGPAAPADVDPNTTSVEILLVVSMADFSSGNVQLRPAFTTLGENGPVDYSMDLFWTSKAGEGFFRARLLVPANKKELSIRFMVEPQDGTAYWPVKREDRMESGQERSVQLWHCRSHPPVFTMRRPVYVTEAMFPFSTRWSMVAFDRAIELSLRYKWLCIQFDCAAINANTSASNDERRDARANVALAAIDVADGLITVAGESRFVRDAIYRAVGGFDVKQQQSPTFEIGALWSIWLLNLAQRYNDAVLKVTLAGLDGGQRTAFTQLVQNVGAAKPQMISRICEVFQALLISTEARTFRRDEHKLYLPLLLSLRDPGIKVVQALGRQHPKDWPSNDVVLRMLDPRTVDAASVDNALAIACLGTKFDDDAFDLLSRIAPRLSEPKHVLTVVQYLQRVPTQQIVAGHLHIMAILNQIPTTVYKGALSGPQQAALQEATNALFKTIGDVILRTLERLNMFVGFWAAAELFYKERAPDPSQPLRELATLSTKQWLAILRALVPPNGLVSWTLSTFGFSAGAATAEQQLLQMLVTEWPKLQAILSVNPDGTDLTPRTRQMVNNMGQDILKGNAPGYLRDDNRLKKITEVLPSRLVAAYFFRSDVQANNWATAMLAVETLFYSTSKDSEFLLLALELAAAYRAVDPDIPIVVPRVASAAISAPKAPTPAVTPAATGTSGNREYSRRGAPKPAAAASSASSEAPTPDASVARPREPPTMAEVVAPLRGALQAFYNALRPTDPADAITIEAVHNIVQSPLARPLFLKGLGCSPADLEDRMQLKSLAALKEHAGALSTLKTKLDALFPAEEGLPTRFTAWARFIAAIRDPKTQLTLPQAEELWHTLGVPGPWLRHLPQMLQSSLFVNEVLLVCAQSDAVVDEAAFLRLLPKLRTRLDTIRAEIDGGTVTLRTLDRYFPVTTNRFELSLRGSADLVILVGPWDPDICTGVSQALSENLAQTLNGYVFPLRQAKDFLPALPWFVRILCPESERWPDLATLNAAVNAMAGDWLALTLAELRSNQHIGRLLQLLRRLGSSGDLVGLLQLVHTVVSSAPPSPTSSVPASAPGSSTLVRPDWVDDGILLFMTTNRDRARFNGIVNGLEFTDPKAIAAANDACQLRARMERLLVDLPLLSSVEAVFDALATQDALLKDERARAADPSASMPTTDFSTLHLTLPVLLQGVALLLMSPQKVALQLLGICQDLVLAVSSRGVDCYISVDPARDAKKSKIGLQELQEAYAVLNSVGTTVTETLDDPDGRIPCLLDNYDRVCQLVALFEKLVENGHPKYWRSQDDVENNEDDAAGSATGEPPRPPSRGSRLSSSGNVVQSVVNKVSLWDAEDLDHTIAEYTTELAEWIEGIDAALVSDDLAPLTFLPWKSLLALVQLVWTHRRQPSLLTAASVLPHLMAALPNLDPAAPDLATATEALRSVCVNLDTMPTRVLLATALGPIAAILQNGNETDRTLASVVDRDPARLPGPLRELAITLMSERLRRSETAAQAAQNHANATFLITDPDPGAAHTLTVALYLATAGSLPRVNEVLLCSGQTSVADINTFMRGYGYARRTAGRPQDEIAPDAFRRAFAVVNCQSLSLEALEALMRHMHTGAAGPTPLPLYLVSVGDTYEARRVNECLRPHRIAATARLWPAAKDKADELFATIAKLLAADARYKATVLDRWHVFCSRYAGCGKSLAVYRHAAQLSERHVYIPCAVHTSRSEEWHAALAAVDEPVPAQPDGGAPSRLLHLDVGFAVGTEANDFLFQMLIFRCLLPPPGMASTAVPFYCWRPDRSMSFAVEVRSSRAQPSSLGLSPWPLLNLLARTEAKVGRDHVVLDRPMQESPEAFQPVRLVRSTHFSVVADFLDSHARRAYDDWYDRAYSTNKLVPWGSAIGSASLPLATAYDRLLQAFDLLPGSAAKEGIKRRPTWILIDNFCRLLYGQLQRLREYPILKPSIAVQMFMVRGQKGLPTAAQTAQAEGFCAGFHTMMVTTTLNAIARMVQWPRDTEATTAGSNEMDDMVLINDTLLNSAWSSRAASALVALESGHATSFMLLSRLVANLGPWFTNDVKSALEENNFVVKDQLNDPKTALTESELMEVARALLGMEGRPFDKDTTRAAAARVAATARQQNWLLTNDGFMKMVMILQRQTVRLPVILQGETGCGKTTLLKCMYEGLLGEQLEIFTLNGGTTLDGLKQWLLEIQGRALSNMTETYNVLLDEANAAPRAVISLVKAVLLERRVGLVTMPDNVRLMAAINPYRKRVARVDGGSDLDAGLVLPYHRDQAEMLKLRQIVYRVNPIPESMMEHMYDYGSLAEEAEHHYLQAMCQRVVTQLPEGDRAALNPEGLGKMLSAVHQTLRDVSSDRLSAVTLRDGDRFTQFLLYFRKSTAGQQLTEPSVPAGTPVTPAAAAQASLRNAVYLALFVSYVCRMHEKERTKLKQAVAQTAGVAGGPLTVAEFEKAMEVAFQRIVHDFNLDKQPLLAPNNALVENILLMACCIPEHTALFIIGKPGSSKSTGADIFFNQLRRPRDQNALCRAWDLDCMEQVYYQCNSDTRTRDLEQAFRNCYSYRDQLQTNRTSATATAANSARIRSLPVLVCDEIGLAELSPDLPLKILHDRLDRLRVEKIGFLALSNWAVDAAKLNRGVRLQRPDPANNELTMTSEHIVRSIAPELAGHFPHRTIVNVYEAVLKYQADNRVKFESQYYGLRDFYFSVKQTAHAMQNHLRVQAGTSRVVPPDTVMLLVAEVVGRNFGSRMDTWNDAVVPVLRAQATQASSAAGAADRVQLAMKPAMVYIHENLVADDPERIFRRHLMISSRNLLALDQLLAHPPLQAVKFVPLFGQAFADDKTTVAISRKLNVIAEAAFHGRVVVLCNCDYLFEDLYFLLNQNYWKLAGDKLISKIAYGHVTKQILINPDFRVIILVEPHQLRTLSVAILQRMQKHTLTPLETCSDASRAVCARLEELDRRWGLSGRLSGGNSEAIPSLVYALDPAGADEVAACQMLLRTMPVRMLWELATQQKEQALANLANDALRQSLQFDLGTHLVDATAAIDAAGTAPQPRPPVRLVVLTMHPLLADIDDVVRGHDAAFTVLDQIHLSAVASSDALERKLRGYFVRAAPPVAGPARVLIIRHDGADEAMDKLQYAKHLIASLSDGASPLHVVLLVHLGGAQRDQFRLSFDRIWQVIAQDELDSKQQRLLRRILVDRTLSARDVVDPAGDVGLSMASFASLTNESLARRAAMVGEGAATHTASSLALSPEDFGAYLRLLSSNEVLDLLRPFFLAAVRERNIAPSILERISKVQGRSMTQVCSRLMQQCLGDDMDHFLQFLDQRNNLRLLAPTADKVLDPFWVRSATLLCEARVIDVNDRWQLSAARHPFSLSFPFSPVWQMLALEIGVGRNEHVELPELQEANSNLLEHMDTPRTEAELGCYSMDLVLTVLPRALRQALRDQLTPAAALTMIQATAAAAAAAAVGTDWRWEPSIFGVTEAFEKWVRPALVRGVDVLEDLADSTTPLTLPQLLMPEQLIAQWLAGYIETLAATPANRRASLARRFAALDAGARRLLPRCHLDDDNDPGNHAAAVRLDDLRTLADRLLAAHLATVVEATGAPVGRTPYDVAVNALRSFWNKIGADAVRLECPVSKTVVTDADAAMEDPDSWRVCNADPDHPRLVHRVDNQGACPVCGAAAPTVDFVPVEAQVHSPSPHLDQGREAIERALLVNLQQLARLQESIAAMAVRMMNVVMDPQLMPADRRWNLAGELLTQLATVGPALLPAAARTSACLMDQMMSQDEEKTQTAINAALANIEYRIGAQQGMRPRADPRAYLVHAVRRMLRTPWMQSKLGLDAGHVGAIVLALPTVERLEQLANKLPQTYEDILDGVRLLCALDHDPRAVLEKYSDKLAESHWTLVAQPMLAHIRFRQGDARMMQLINVYRAQLETRFEAVSDMIHAAEGTILGVTLDGLTLPAPHAGRGMDVSGVADWYYRVEVQRRPVEMERTDELLAAVQQPLLAGAVRDNFSAVQMTRQLNEEWMPMLALHALEVLTIAGLEPYASLLGAAGGDAATVNAVRRAHWPAGPVFGLARLKGPAFCPEGHLVFIGGCTLPMPDTLCPYHEPALSLCPPGKDHAWASGSHAATDAEMDHLPGFNYLRMQPAEGQGYARNVPRVLLYTMEVSVAAAMLAAVHVKPDLAARWFPALATIERDFFDPTELPAALRRHVLWGLRGLETALACSGDDARRTVHAALTRIRNARQVWSAYPLAGLADLGAAARLERDLLQNLFPGALDKLLPEVKQAREKATDASKHFADLDELCVERAWLRNWLAPSPDDRPAYEVDMEGNEGPPPERDGDGAGPAAAPATPAAPQANVGEISDEVRQLQLTASAVLRQLPSDRPANSILRAVASTSTLYLLDALQYLPGALAAVGRLTAHLHGRATKAELMVMSLGTASERAGVPAPDLASLLRLWALIVPIADNLVECNVKGAAVVRRVASTLTLESPARMVLLNLGGMDDDVAVMKSLVDHCVLQHNELLERLRATTIASAAAPESAGVNDTLVLDVLRVNDLAPALSAAVACLNLHQVERYAVHVLPLFPASHGASAGTNETREAMLERYLARSLLASRRPLQLSKPVALATSDELRRLQIDQFRAQPEWNHADVSDAEAAEVCNDVQHQNKVLVVYQALDTMIGWAARLHPTHIRSVSLDEETLPAFGNRCLTADQLDVIATSSVVLARMQMRQLLSVHTAIAHVVEGRPNPVQLLANPGLAPVFCDTEHSAQQVADVTERLKRWIGPTKELVRRVYLDALVSTIHLVADGTFKDRDAPSPLMDYFEAVVDAIVVPGKTADIERAQDEIKLALRTVSTPLRLSQLTWLVRLSYTTLVVSQPGVN